MKARDGLVAKLACESLEIFWNNLLLNLRSSRLSVGQIPELVAVLDSKWQLDKLLTTTLMTKYQTKTTTLFLSPSHLSALSVPIEVLHPS